MVHFFCIIPGRLIRNQTYAKHSHTHVTRYNYFWSSRHTDSISSSRTQKLQFRTRLIARPCYLSIHSFMQCDFRPLSGDSTCQRSQFSIVSLCQSWKAFSKSFIIWSNQWIHPCEAQEIDMIANEHKV